MVGQLHASPRAGESAFSPADERLLHDLARQIGAAARATLLTEELQRSRERLVTAREEERRRLRRELHDDLGPTLSAVSLKAGGIRGALKRDPTVVDALVVDLMGDIQTSVKNIRQLAYELRPPALDEMGLVGAIKALAAHRGEGDENVRPRLDVVAPDSIAPLPAAHEVAAYRIAAEAFANVLRHARARTCTIRITIDTALTLEVVDDGVGLSPGGRAGVGVLSMRERAEELGGTLMIESERGQGTTVRAQLPLVKDS
jgi:signal transduction histidine kinase